MGMRRGNVEARFALLPPQHTGDSLMRHALMEEMDKRMI